MKKNVKIKKRIVAIRTIGEYFLGHSKKCQTNKKKERSDKDFKVRILSLF